jgi:8-amino-7-oxononanoate synthase
VLDFTSALYLGMHHLRDELEPWPRFTTGKPAALEEDAGARAVARSLAALQGAEAAVLAPSTLHVAWDLFGMLEQLQPIAIYRDAGSYPVGGWGAERAACRGTPVHRFAHHRPAALRRAMASANQPHRRPVVVTDGFCPACGRLAPLREYLACAAAAAGWLVIDDTQALGILGHSPDRALPYGYGGGGSLRHVGLRSPRAVIISSLAKGFGVPAAVLSGSAEAVAAFEQHSETRAHCSPPSVATVRAARHALAVNRRGGNALRHDLARRVGYFRRRLAARGLAVSGGWFPVQTLALRAVESATKLHAALERRGIHAVLQSGHDGTLEPGPRLGFLLTTEHRRTDLDLAFAALDDLLPPSSQPTPDPEARYELTPDP